MVAHLVTSVFQSEPNTETVYDFVEYMDTCEDALMSEGEDLWAIQGSRQGFSFGGF